MSATIQRLSGERLHLQHGPIDVVLKAFGAPAAIAAAERAAARRFVRILPELAVELALLRTPVGAEPAGPVARRMVAACRPFADVFVTPMAAVAGSVADEILAEMLDAAPLARAFVNDGGDIAIHLAEGETLNVGMAADFSRGATPLINGTIAIAADMGIGGIATSGAQGRSFSLGIADSVTVLARTAATADVAATLIANAVDCDHAGIVRAMASSLDPDSDLGARLVTVAVPSLPPASITEALERGRERALDYRRRGLIVAAALTLQGRTVSTDDWLALPASGMRE